MTGNPFDGWVPAGVDHAGGVLRVRWLRAGGIRYAEPFFSQTLGRCRAESRAALATRESTLDELASAAEREAAPAPRGFIFHLSRCGSTLVAQMLAALPGATVISEAPPIDAILRAHHADPAITAAQRERWLRAMLGMIGRSSAGTGPLFVKFDAWSVLELPLIHRAFPQVPWVFVCREPLEVLRSHALTPGAHMVPGALDPRALGWTQVPPWNSLEDHGAAVLTRICDAAAAARANCGRNCVVDYADLPAAVAGRLLGFFGLECQDADLDRMGLAARRDAKNPAVAFGESAAPAPVRAVTPLGEHVARALRLSYERLRYSGP